MLTNKIANSSFVLELKQNPRLQWLLLAVLIILAVSGLKSGVDHNAEVLADLNAQQNATARLVKALNTEIDENYLSELESNVSSLLQEIPSAETQSLAEAQALSNVGQLREQAYNEGRTTLVGTELVILGSQEFYQTRLELSGNHQLIDLIDTLKFLEERNTHVRLVSLQLRNGNRNNSLVLVVDYLHKKAIS